MPDTSLPIIKALYEKENPGVPFGQWLAAKHNGRAKNGFAKAWIKQPSTAMSAYKEAIKIQP